MDNTNAIIKINESLEIKIKKKNIKKLINKNLIKKKKKIKKIKKIKERNKRNKRNKKNKRNKRNKWKRIIKKLKFLIHLIKVIFIIVSIIFIKYFPINSPINLPILGYLNMYVVHHKDYYNNLTNPYYKILCDKTSQLKNQYQLKIIETYEDNELFFKSRLC